MPRSMSPGVGAAKDSGLHVVGGKRATTRRRANQLASGVLDLLDAEMEHRSDDEEIAKSFSVRRPDALFLFAKRTRKMLRRIESQIRRIDDQLRGRMAA